MIEKYSCAIPFKILQKSWIFEDSRYINCVDSNGVVIDSGSDQSILPYNACGVYAHVAFFMLRGRGYLNGSRQWRRKHGRGHRF